MHSDIAVAMGGRIAEEIIFGHDKVTSGASSDIDMVTKMAKNMVTKYGMSTELGTIAYGENEEEVFLGRSVTKQQNVSEETAVSSETFCCFVTDLPKKTSSSFSPYAIVPSSVLMPYLVTIFFAILVTISISDEAPDVTLS